MQVKVADGFLFVKTPYDDREWVKTILNGIWSKAHGMCRFPTNYHALTELEKAYPSLRSNPTFSILFSKVKQAREERALAKSRTDAPGDPRLRPYQRVDVEYLASLPSAGIFNKPRTGKTPTSIALIQKLGTKRNLVITPASLIWNWVKEFQKWAPEVMVYVLSGTPKQRAKVLDNYMQERGLNFKQVLIVSKDTWKAVVWEWDTLEFDTVFVDEAHYLRNYKSAQSKAVMAVNAKRRFALTGTPTVKHATDIWAILHFLYPKKFTSFWMFVERYFVVSTDWMGHVVIGDVKPEREAELQEIVGLISVQRERSEVMAWLPEKNRIPFFVKMESKQAKIYKQMVEDFMIVDDESGEELLDTSGVLAQLMRMRQICLDPRLVGLDAPSAKTTALLEWLDDNREPVVVMSVFTSYLKLIKADVEALGLKVGMIHGEMEHKEKFATAEQFQAGKLDVLLCNIKAAGVGFTLDRAETIIFTDKEWNPADNEQAEDRIVPIDESRNHSISVLTFQCQDSYDEAINKILDRKQSITSVINQGGRAAIQALLKGATT
jgi:SNF2 family DNA or RNA helicase